MNSVPEGNNSAMEALERRSGTQVLGPGPRT